MSEPLWKPIPADLPTTQPIIGGWYTRGSWRVGVCDWADDVLGSSGWYSERGATPTHYLCAIPVAAPEPVQPVTGPVALDASPDPAVTDWDGDPTGPPLV